MNKFEQFSVDIVKSSKMSGWFTVISACFTWLLFQLHINDKNIPIYAWLPGVLIGVFAIASWGSNWWSLSKLTIHVKLSRIYPSVLVLLFKWFVSADSLLFLFLHILTLLFVCIVLDLVTIIVYNNMVKNNDSN